MQMPQLSWVSTSLNCLISRTCPLSLLLRNGSDVLSLFARLVSDVVAQEFHQPGMLSVGLRTSCKGFERQGVMWISIASIGMGRRWDSFMTTYGARKYYTTAIGHHAAADISTQLPSARARSPRMDHRIRVHELEYRCTVTPRAR